MKKLQCEQCHQAKKGEALYYFNGQILCRYCIVAKICEDSSNYCEYVGEAGDNIDGEVLKENINWGFPKREKNEINN